MAYIARRPKGRFEIRESVLTSRGPRSRSLATFTTLDDDVIARAERAATTKFEHDAVRASAQRAGAPVAPSAADDAARTLLRLFHQGVAPTPALRRLLAENIGSRRAARLDAGTSIGEWVGASPEDRGAALRELLDLTDRLPATRRDRRLAFPGLRARRG